MTPGALLGETTGLFCVDVLNREGSCIGGLVFKAHRLLNHSTLGSRVAKKKKKNPASGVGNTG